MSTAQGSERNSQLRQDAATNREQILIAAAEIFAERGTDVGVSAIARGASVGMGTLYRRFPTKQSLISELVRQVFTELNEAGERCLRAPGGTGLEQYLYLAGSVLAKHRGCISELWSDGRTAGIRARNQELVLELLASAKAHDRVVELAQYGDVEMIFISIRATIKSTYSVTPDAWRRHLGLMLNGILVHRVVGDLGPAVSIDEVNAIKSSIGHRREPGD